MQTIDFENLKIEMQIIIDLIANNNLSDANDKLNKLSIIVDDLFDSLTNDKDLREISRYQILILQLQKKANTNGKQ